MAGPAAGRIVRHGMTSAFKAKAGRRIGKIGIVSSAGVGRTDGEDGAVPLTWPRK